MLKDNETFLGGGEKVRIRRLQEKDKGIYRIMSSHSSNSILASDDKIYDVLWNYIQKDPMLVCAIVENRTSTICGFCQLNKLNTDTPEIGVDILDGYMGQGYAFEATKLLMQYAVQEFTIQYFVWQAYTSNSTSRHLAEKHGGVLIGEAPFLPEKILQHMLETGVMQPDEICYVCTYHIAGYCKETFASGEALNRDTDSSRG